MKRLRIISLILARASLGNPVISTAVVCMFYLMFNMLVAQIETLICGERFEHWLDPVFLCAWIAYAAYAVYCCAIHNSKKEIFGGN